MICLCKRTFLFSGQNRTSKNKKRSINFADRYNNRYTLPKAQYHYSHFSFLDNFDEKSVVLFILVTFLYLRNQIN